MILGIGVDTVDIERIQRMLGEESGRFVPVGSPEPKRTVPVGAEEPAFFRRVFSEAERAAAPKGKVRAEYYAARFAAKEAVFKAVAHCLPEKTFDLRDVETLKYEDGCPYVVTDGKLAPVFETAGVKKLHISITTEKGCATAFVIAEG